jgi:8-oxo-dGTP diphosphatase
LVIWLVHGWRSQARGDQIRFMEFVRAAGGLLWRGGPGRPRLALVHRPDHADWSLPKGKLDPLESWGHAAVREVAEETGCHARITAFAGAKLLVEREVPKLILYWHMLVVREGVPLGDEEVDEVAWLAPRQALARLDSASDRRLLLQALPDVKALALGEAARGRTDRETLRARLVLDGRCSEAQLDPYLRLIERTVSTIPQGLTAA